MRVKSQDRERDRLQLLQEITQEINEGRSLEEVFDLIYARLKRFVPYDRIAVAVSDEARERLTILSVRSDGPVFLEKGYSAAISGSSLQALVREGQTRIINDLTSYLGRRPASEATRLIVKEGMRSSLTLPLLVQGKPHGVMFFSSREPGTYRVEHEEFLRGIVGSMAIAIERTRLIDELRQKGDYLENILQNSADAIIVIDREDRIRTWNEGARRIFGYPAEQVRGEAFSVLMPEDLVLSGELARMREAVEREGFLKDYETVRVTREGKKIEVNVTSTLLRGRDGEILGRSAILRDVSGVKKLQADLVRSQSLAAIGELAATIAHEVKNPLAGISGAIQVLRDAIPASDPRREVVREILEQIRRLDDTVRDLLAFARPATPNRTEIDLGESLGSAWSVLAPQPEACRVTLSLVGAHGVKIGADAQLLHQVWINLFQNAIEAMSGGGDLIARVTPGGTVRVEVEDGGAGFGPHEVAKLFRPFFSTKARGTGLGLAISRKIVEAHGGAIWIEPRREGGTRVTVELPTSS